MDPAAFIFAAAALLVALGVIGRALARLRKVWLRGEEVFEQLLGKPATDEQPAVPSLRALADKTAGDVHQIKGAMPHLALTLDVERLADQITAVQAQLVDVRAMTVKTDGRVTDHRRRGDKYADDLRTELDTRNREVDRRFDQALAALSELTALLPRPPVVNDQETET